MSNDVISEAKDELLGAKAVIPEELRAGPVLRVVRATRVWLVLAAAVVVWQLVCDWFDVATYLFPKPTDILSEFREQPSLYLDALRATATETVLGFLAALAVGVLLAVLMTRIPLFEQLVFPFLNIIRVTPTVTIAPLLTIWFGRGLIPVVVASFLIAFFPIIVQTMLGMKSVDPGLVDLLRISNASEPAILWKAELPNAMPYLFSSFRVAAPGAVVGALLGEFLGASQGLGYLVTVNSGQLNAAGVFLVAVLSCALGIVVFELCVFAEKRVVKWHPSVQL